MSDAETIIAAAAKATLSPRDYNNILEKMEQKHIREWIEELITRGHGSPLEHSLYVFEIVCSRVCSHQLVRHRHASYSQLSQRYSDKYLRGLVEGLARALNVEPPKTHNEVVGLIKMAIEKLSYDELVYHLCEGFILPPRVLESRDRDFLTSLLNSVAQYYKALEEGAPYEDARYVLPQAVKTRLVVSMNARELVEVFLPLRMCSRAQWEIRLIAWSMWKQLVEAHPAIFKYTGPRCILVENRVRTRPCTLEELAKGTCSFTIERCPEKLPRNNIRECLYNAGKGFLVYNE
jgi:thymidylate synthase (FAD)